jgi:hypothetical protein
MDVMRACAYLLSLSVLLAAPVSVAAAAPHTNAPPGNSAIDEYLETVPGASGDTRPRPPRARGGGTLSPAQRAELRAHGTEGEILSRVVDATSPSETAPASAPAPAPATARAPVTPHAASAGRSPHTGGPGRSPVAATLAAATGSDSGSSLGPLLAAILLVSLLAVIALVAIGRSRRRERA